MKIVNRHILVTAIFILIHICGYSQNATINTDTVKELNYTTADSAKFYIIDIKDGKIVVTHDYKSFPIKTTNQLAAYIKRHLEKIKKTKLSIVDHDLEDDYPGFLSQIIDIIYDYHFKDCNIWQDQL